MILVEQAKKLIIDNISVNKTEEEAVVSALGMFLSEDVIAPCAVPMFNQSAMDGYAFRFNERDEKLKVVDEVPAGDIRTIQLHKGEAVRIFTGSKVPNDCDTVVMQELIEIEQDRVVIKDEGLRLGGNIRKKGSQINKGEVALQKGTQITAAGIGFLSSLGIENVKVYASPKVTVIATGSELIKPGNDLKEGQIFESNSYMLQAALHKMFIQSTVITVKDDEKETREVIEQAIKNSDVVLLSGGISVGDYDFVKSALEQLNVKEVFYKVKQKPGKPLYFGKKEQKVIFALPGNPAAALSCFYEYVYPAINLMMGSANPFLPTVHLPITRDYTKKAGRAIFLKGVTNFKTVELLEGQGSDILRSFATSNCLVFISDKEGVIKKGEIVETHLLP